MGEINLKRNILVTGGFRIAIMLVIFITSWISTRFLGATLKGQYSYLITLVGFIWLVLDLGIHKTYPYLLRKEPEQAGNLFTWAFLLFLGEVVLLGILGTLFLPQWSKLLGYEFNLLSIWLLIGLIALNHIFNLMQMFYLGLDRIKENSLGQFFNQVIMLILVLVAVVFARELNRLQYILIASNLTMLIVVMGYGWNYLRSGIPKALSPMKMISYYPMGFRVFLSSLFITLLLRADVVIIKQIMGYQSVGIYSLAAHMVDMMQLASNVVGGLLLVKLADTEDEIKRWVLMKQVFILFVMLLGAANLAFVVLGSPLITIFYGKEFSATYNAYLWLIPASFGLSLGSLFNTYLWSKGFPMISVILPFLALLSNIILNYLLIPVMGIAGAGLASSISYCLWFILIVIYEQKLSGNRMLKYMMPKAEDIVMVWDTMSQFLNGLIRKI